MVMMMMMIITFLDETCFITSSSQPTAPIQGGCVNKASCLRGQRSLHYLGVTIQSLSTVTGGK